MKKSSFVFFAFVFLFLISRLTISGWQVINTNSPPMGWSQIGFCNANTGYVFSTASVQRTTDGGSNWQYVYFEYSMSKKYMFVTVSNQVYISGDSIWSTYTYGNIKRSSGGSGWADVYFAPTFNQPAKHCFNIYMANPTYGYCVLTDSGYVKMLRTVDGGSTWLLQNHAHLQSVNYFASHTSNANTAYAAGTGIMKTTDAGYTWFSLTTSGSYGSIACVDSTGIVMAVGLSGLASRSTNGGATWSTVQVSSQSYNFRCIRFPNASTGYIVGDGGVIFRTTNKGLNWTAQNSGTTANLLDCSFVNDQTGYAAGSNVIIKTTNGGVSSVRQTGSVIPSEYSLSQNYPNPFNPSTSIKFCVPLRGKVTVSVFNVTGREVAEPVNENLNPGEYEISFDASMLASGIYFLRMKSAEYSETKKMILLK